jgi:hypothetical protein
MWGQNLLGKILMKIRDELVENSKKKEKAKSKMRPSIEQDVAKG